MNDVQPVQELPRLMIQVLPDGNMNVTGPIDNQLLAYGMLEWAKITIFQHNMKKLGHHISRPSIDELRALKEGEER